MEMEGGTRHDAWTTTTRATAPSIYLELIYVSPYDPRKRPKITCQQVKTLYSWGTETTPTLITQNDDHPPHLSTLRLHNLRAALPVPLTPPTSPSAPLTHAQHRRLARPNPQPARLRLRPSPAPSAPRPDARRARRRPAARQRLPATGDDWDWSPLRDVGAEGGAELCRCVGDSGCWAPGGYGVGGWVQALVRCRELELDGVGQCGCYGVFVRYQVGVLVGAIWG